MNPDLHQDITRRLDAEFEFKKSGKWLRGGKCPSCHKKELYTNAEEPWVVRCGRENKCAWSSHVKDLYPDAFNSWSERYKPSDTNPNAAADAYLQYGRGFKLDLIKGLYEQANYYDPERKFGTATVRFPLPSGGYWERLIDKPERFG
ncbi:MAG: bifunctional DNA primase/helicase, partial [Gammaproteobacteria bacterium HGW-Gammaproteobacteria-8]